MGFGAKPQEESHTDGVARDVGEKYGLERGVEGSERTQNKKGKSKDVLLRNLDCAVIQQIHEYNKSEGIRSYDSVRGIFLEGEPVYEGSEFMEKTHTQVSILNPNCIKGFFVPRGMDDKFVLP